MSNTLLVDKILDKIDFKIQPDENIRKAYLYRFKKKLYKIIYKEREFINSNTSFNNIDNTKNINNNQSKTKPINIPNSKGVGVKYIESNVSG